MKRQKKPYKRLKEDIPYQQNFSELNHINKTGFINNRCKKWFFMNFIPYKDSKIVHINSVNVYCVLWLYILSSICRK